MNFRRVSILEELKANTKRIVQENNSYSRCVSNMILKLSKRGIIVVIIWLSQEEKAEKEKNGDVVIKHFEH
jgi:hypothetical protein